MDKISLVIPCYNEEEALPLLKIELDKIIKKMNKVNFEIILVDNCSNDKTLEIMKNINKEDKKYQYISFSRNFGKDASMYAGLKYSTGDYIAIMDADMQDPPEMLPIMYDEIKNGEYDSIATFRGDRKGEPKLRSYLAKKFYKLMSKLTNIEIKSGARDFRLMSREMVDAVLLLNENERFTKGIFSWVGFSTKWISFKNHERIAGKTKLPMKSAIDYAIKGITSFSNFSLLSISLVGILLLFIGFINMIYIIIKICLKKIIYDNALIILILLFGFGLILFILGIIGEYLKEIYLEVKNRPKFIIKESSKEIKK